MNIALLTLPVISAAIGWFTNFIAIKMLFYPREEQQFLFFKLQGIFPKRKAVLAERLGHVVAVELFSMETIKEEIDLHKKEEELRISISNAVDSLIIRKLEDLPGVVRALISEKRIGRVRSAVDKEVAEMLPVLIGQFLDAVEEVDIKAIVEEKINGFTSERLESLLMSVLSSELRFIEWAGAILGFMIGVLQLLMVYYLA